VVKPRGGVYTNRLPTTVGIMLMIDPCGTLGKSDERADFEEETMTARLQPKVGIFWLMGKRLILDASPLSEAELYGDCLTQRNSHIDYWTAQQRLGTVPRDIEYEEPPRGRVVFDTKADRFMVYADRCILAKEPVVSRILKEMNLPRGQTDVQTDGHYGHYKCFRCLEQTLQIEEDEDAAETEELE
jgi:hypothetical protein